MNIYTHGAQSLEGSSGRLDPDVAGTVIRLAGAPSVLVGVLLAANANHLVAIVPNNHPDLSSQAAQQALTELVASKYALRLRRSTPTPDHAVVEATAVEPAAWTVAQELLLRAHGKLANVWREALIQSSDRPLTKNAARAWIADAVTRPDWLDARLIDLPRDAVGSILAVAAPIG